MCCSLLCADLELQHNKVRNINYVAYSPGQAGWDAKPRGGRNKNSIAHTRSQRRAGGEYSGNAAFQSTSEVGVSA